MEFLDILTSRYSSRCYTTEDIPEKSIQYILQAGLLAPSGRGIYPIDFIVVKDKNILKKLSECKISSAHMLNNANCAIVVIGDTSKSDMIIEDASIVMTIMHLAATNIGIGSCWIQCRNRYTNSGESTNSYIQRLLQYPSVYCVEAILSLGMIPTGEDIAKKSKTIDESRIHIHTFL